jgi:hypothetical protein
MAALLAAIVVFALLSVPPASRQLPSYADGTVPGIIHVHTNRSDGHSPPDEVAAAAARAGLKFVIFTDHGDATRVRDAPAYRSGVLCVDGVEISTAGGHYVAIGLPPAPYPLGGEARDVVEDVRRLGGFGIAAHPDSPKPELAWREWSAPFDGIELLNLDTGWRALAHETGWSPKWRLLKGIAAYPLRPSEAITSTLVPTGALSEWERLIAERRVVVAAGADAHARLAFRGIDSGAAALALPLPSYESSFRVVSVHVKPDVPFTGRAADDAEALLTSIRAGHLYVALDGVASPPAFEFTATNQAGTVQQGDELTSGAAVLLHVRSNAPPDFTTIVYDGARPVTTVHDSQDVSVHESAKAGVYWVEIVGGQPPQTWIRSNPIYVRDRPTARVAATGPLESAVDVLPLFDGRTTKGLTVERDQTSLGAIEVVPGAGQQDLLLRYTLSSGGYVNQFSGFAFDLPNGTGGRDRLALTLHADRPMRLSIQARTLANERWHRSIFVDTTDQERVVKFDDMVRIAGPTASRPPLDRICSVLLIVETTNAKPGASGRVWIRRAQLQK